MTISIDPLSLGSGDVATVTISGSSHKNELVTVTIDNGLGDSQDIQIQLDGNGNGEGPWTVAEGWPVANFNKNSCAEVSITITAGPG